MLFYFLYILIIVLIAALLAEAVTLPLVGTLVRFRANYAPRGLQLDQEGGVQPHAGPVVKSYFAMMNRVVKLEGLQGLYKGFVPSVISTFLVTVFTYIFIGATLPRGHGRYSAPTASPLQLIVFTFFVTTVGLPLTILFNRAVTTPYFLPWLQPGYALRRLLTPTELRRPWVLYLTPGLLTAKLLHVCYVVVVLRSARSLLLPSFDEIGKGTIPSEPLQLPPLRFGIYILIASLSTIVLCPLEVIATRLSLQRNHAGGAAEVPQQEEEAGNNVDVEYAGTEDVIGLRNERDPYVTFIDAATRMREEEGVQALYRGWWITLAASALSAFV